MGEAVTEGVCRSIHSCFGKEYAIYTEKAEQGFKRPSFFVQKEGGSLELFRGKRYYMKNALLVTYYPPYKCRKEEMTGVGERLAACLGLIEAEGDKIRGGAVTLETEAECLKCRVSYDFFVIIESVEEAAELMQEYKLNFKE